MTTLTSSLSSLSFSSKISPETHAALSFSRSKNPLLSSTAKVKTTARLVVKASSAAVAEPSEAADVEEPVNLMKYVKSRLPGGFAAQTIFGTGRRKCAIARVVLQEGTGKVIINYRDANVLPSLSLSSYVFTSVLGVVFDGMELYHSRN